MGAGSDSPPMVYLSPQGHGPTMPMAINVIWGSCGDGEIVLGFGGWVVRKHANDTITWKRTILWGDTEGMLMLGGRLQDSSKNESSQTYCVESSGIRGGRDLKSTQAYPSGFGLQVCQSHFAFVKSSSDPYQDRDAADSECDSEESFSCIDDVLALTSELLDCEL